MVRTRFAPSPTGYLHIGGVRTALFNWLYARKHGGQFVLRIDDTDQQRNVAEALQPILDGFRWLGLDWDEGPDVGGPHGPYYQSQKPERYQEAVRQLLDKGLAYWDYATADELKAEREAAEKEKRSFVYSRRWMAETPAERAKFEAEGRKGVVRLKMPREGVCRFTDHIRGEVEVAWATEQDHVIQRADGGVLYNLANVVDDFDMKISHVIRAEEHLANTPRQVFMLEGLGYPRPEYAHVPFVAEPGSKNKLSKRKIAQYLKNPDFKKVYEHGAELERFTRNLEIARRMWKLVKEWKEAKPDAKVSHERIARTAKILKPLYVRWPLESRTAEAGNETKELIAHLDSEDLDWLLEHPQVIENYARGKQIIDRSGNVLSPDTYNPVLVEFYKQVGYLPDAIVNYLVLLGWSLDDRTEFFTRDEMVRLFSLERVNKAPASLDVKKLFAFQERYMQELPVAEKVAGVLPFLQTAGLVSDPIPDDVRATVTRVIEAAGPRLKVFGDIIEYDYFFLPDDHFVYDEKALDKHVRKPPGSEWLPELRAIVAAAEPFDAETLKRRVEEFVQAKGAKPIPVSQTLRVAVTGKEVGFGTYETLAILGRDRCLARIDRALALAAAPTGRPAIAGGETPGTGQA